jgi:hypothetical protein
MLPKWERNRVSVRDRRTVWLSWTQLLPDRCTTFGGESMADTFTGRVSRIARNSPEIIRALESAYIALSADSNDAEYDALLALMGAVEELLVEEATDAPVVHDGSPAKDGALPQSFKTTVPTYNGKWLEELPGLRDFDEPEVPVLVMPADGVRIVLGSHDYHDFEKPDIQIERRHNGWMIFLHPVGGGDPSGCVVFLDDGRSFVSPEGAWDECQIKMVDYEQATAELDEIKPDGLSCKPAQLVDQTRNRASLPP